MLVAPVGRCDTWKRRLPYQDAGPVGIGVELSTAGRCNRGDVLSRNDARELGVHLLQVY